MKTRKICRIIGVSVLILGLVVSYSGIAAAKSIRVGGILDMTGATSDVGKDYALGMAEAFNYFNDMGGVNGNKIKYTYRSCQRLFR